LSKSVHSERLRSRTTSELENPVISWINVPKFNWDLLSGWKGRVVRFVRVLGPYAAIELLLPGGSLIALLLWLYQTQRRKTALGQNARRGMFSRRDLSTKISQVGDFA
jgi:hypothetical protein